MRSQSLISAENAGGIVGQADVGGQFDGDPLGVPPADVAVVEEHEAAQHHQRGRQAGVPFLVARLAACLLAQHLVVGVSVLAQRVLGQLYVRRQLSLPEQGRPDTGAESYHELQALAPNQCGTLDVGVVGHPARFAESIGQGTLQVERAHALSSSGAGLPPGPEGDTKWGADRTRPVRTMPGKPAETRW